MSNVKSRHHVKRDHVDTFGRRQPRPAPRRQGTRQGQIRAAVKEG